MAPPYTALIQPPAGLPANCHSYYYTEGRPLSGINPAEILDPAGAPPWWTPAGNYPGQRYAGLSIDNALVRYQGGAAPPHHTTILARPVATPYAAPVPPPAPAPMQGYYQSNPWMDDTIPNLFAQVPVVGHLFDLNTTFRDWDNYGGIYTVSDHFALIFDV